jgi:hypothetical protein
MIKRVLLLIAIVCGLSGAAFAQTALTQTTLAAAVTIGTAGGASGISGSYQTTISLTSATGIQVANNGQPITFVYIDQELFGVLSLVTGQTTIYNVLRGQLGTRAAAHSLGAMALIQVVSPQFGGFAGSGGFQQTDPPGGLGASCTAASTLAYPWVNVLTGWQWLCSSVTGSWTPGFNNPLLFVAPAPNGTTVASVAGATAVPSSFFSVSGTNAITSWTLPVGCGGQTPVAAATVGTCVFGIYPTGAFTTTATNNIANATTAVAGKVMWWTYNPVTQKFGSSY